MVRLEQLLESGANPNNYTCACEVPLSFAASKCSESALRQLIVAGAKTTNTWAELALRNSIQARCSTEVISVLLDGGVDPNASYYLGDTVLMDAVRQNNLAVARLLLQRGADPNRVARWEGHVMATIGETTPLILAANLDSVEMVALLLEFGAQPGMKDVFGYSARRMALEKGYLDVASLLPEELP